MTEPGDNSQVDDTELADPASPANRAQESSWFPTTRTVVGELPQLPEGREVDRTMLPVLAAGFVDALRSAGINVAISSTLQYVQALGAINSLDRSARYWCGRTTLITRPEDFMTYHRVFGAYWTGAEYREETETLTMTTSVALDDGPDDPDDDTDQPDTQDDVTPDAIMRYSAIEVLRDRDFGDYTKDELRELSFLVKKLRVGGSTKSSRRSVPSKKSTGKPDLRRTVRRALTTDAEPVSRAYRRRSVQNRRVVLLLDISGSMESYSRALLRFVHATVVARGRVEVFSLGTRLTRLTRELATLDPDRALANAGDAVNDWSGGTRLGESLRSFNDEWAVRGMARGAVVVVMSDGWDRGEPEVMAEQMARLSRVAHRIIWSNPLKATDGYQPLARGMAAALPWVDEFVEGHSLRALETLALAVNRSTTGIELRDFARVAPSAGR